MEFVKPETIEVRFSEEEVEAMKAIYTVLGALTAKMDSCGFFYLARAKPMLPSRLR